MTQKYVITEVSRNAKTGPIMVTTSASDTCPKACPLRKDAIGGCYASGGPLAAIWRGLDATEAGDAFTNGKGRVAVKSFDDLLTAIERQPAYKLWRHNQAGDLAGQGNTIDIVALAAITKANAKAKARGFTYTHKPCLGNSPLAVANREAIAQANADGFTVNLSGNNIAHADKLVALNAGPVVAVVTVEGDFTTPAGNKAKQCPATVDGSDMNCERCGICQIADRDYIVTFPVHGAAKRKAAQVAK